MSLETLKCQISDIRKICDPSPKLRGGQAFVGSLVHDAAQTLGVNYPNTFSPGGNKLVFGKVPHDLSYILTPRYDQRCQIFVGDRDFRLRLTLRSRGRLGVKLKQSFSQSLLDTTSEHRPDAPMQFLLPFQKNTDENKS